MSVVVIFSSGYKDLQGKSGFIVEFKRKLMLIYMKFIVF